MVIATPITGLDNATPEASVMVMPLAKRVSAGHPDSGLANGLLRLEPLSPKGAVSAGPPSQSFLAKAKFHMHPEQLASLGR